MQHMHYPLIEASICDSFNHSMQTTVTLALFNKSACKIFSMRLCHAEDAMNNSTDSPQLSATHLAANWIPVDFGTKQWQFC